MAAQPKSMPVGMTFEVTPFGGGPGENIERYLRQCDMHVRPWSEMFDESEMNELKLSTLARNLRDDARRWFDEDTSGDVREDFDSLKLALIARYRNRAEPDAALQAVRDLDNLKQNGQPVDRYLAEARRIHRQLPESIRPRVQEVMLANMTDGEVRKTIEILLDLRDVPPSFEQVCNLVSKAGRKKAEAVNQRQSDKTPFSRPSREEEEQMRIYQMIRDTAREDREALVTSLTAALTNLKFPTAAVNPEVSGRTTYPANADPQQDRAGKRVSGDSPCYTCWEFGHYSGDCPRGAKGLTATDRRDRYDNYANAEIQRGREPCPFLGSKNTGYRKNVTFPDPKPIPVAAYTGEASNDCDNYTPDGCLVCADENIGSAEGVIRRLVQGVNEYPSSDGSAEDDLSDRCIYDPEDHINCHDRYQAAAVTGQRRTRADAELSSDIPLVTKAQRKTKRSTRKTQGPRHIRLMAGEPEFDIADMFRNKLIEASDGITIGRLCDLSPQITAALAKSLVRPSNRHAYADPAKTGSTGAGAQNFVEALTIAPISNLYTAAVLHESGRKDAFELHKVLMDAGSTFDFINKQVAQRLNLKVYTPDFKRLKVADGKYARITGMVVVEVKLKNKINRKLRLYIMDGDTPFSILLGLPALHAFLATADFRPNPPTYRIREYDGAASTPITRQSLGENSLTEMVRPGVSCRRDPNGNSQGSLGYLRGNRGTRPDVYHQSSASEVSNSETDDHDLVAQANADAHKAIGRSAGGHYLLENN